MRKSRVYLFYLAINISLLLFMFLHASRQQRAEEPALRARGEIVRVLELTDLCLFTEARYTRHLSQADLHAPFQDFPLSLEHFPSGSLLNPPETLKRINGKLD